MSAKAGAPQWSKGSTPRRAQLFSKENRESYKGHGAEQGELGLDGDG